MLMGQVKNGLHTILQPFICGNILNTGRSNNLIVSAQSLMMTETVSIMLLTACIWKPLKWIPCSTQSITKKLKMTVSMTQKRPGDDMPDKMPNVSPCDSVYNRKAFNIIYNVLFYALLIFWILNVTLG